MDLYYGYYTLLMDNILSLFPYTLLYTFVALYTLSYTLSYILHSPRIFYTTLIYSLIRLYTLIYSLLSYTLMALLILPRRFIPLPSLLYSLIYLFSLSYILVPFILIPLYSYIVIPTLLYRKGITTLPPIFTHFTSLS